MINVYDNYWVIGGSAAEVYQSKTNTMVPVNDATYTNWLKANAPSPVSSVDELSGALRANGSPLPEWLLATQPTFIQPSPGAYANEQLAAYSASVRFALDSGGVFVSSISATVPFLTDAVSRNSVNSSWDWMHTKGATSINWKMSDSTFMTLTVAQMDTLTNAVVTFVQACFNCESNMLASITSGTVTTLAQIDAAYAAVSNVYP